MRFQVDEMMSACLNEENAKGKHDFVIVAVSRQIWPTCLVRLSPFACMI